MRDPGKPISPATLNRALEYLDMKGWHCHDFRATASTHLHEMGRWRPEVIEMQLAHAEQSKTRAAYNHAQYLPERIDMMQFWADYILRHNNLDVR
ncbi:Prophage integrase IntA [compost metagenome]